MYAINAPPTSSTAPATSTNGAETMPAATAKPMAMAAPTPSSSGGAALRATSPQSRSPEESPPRVVEAERAAAGERVGVDVTSKPAGSGCRKRPRRGSWARLGRIIALYTRRGSGVDLHPYRHTYGGAPGAAL